MTYIKLFFYILILFFVVTKTEAQNVEYQNLKEYVAKNSLYDFGYGLDKYESRLDSIVCFNDFLIPGIYFKKLDEKFSFRSNDSTFSIHIEKKKEKIKRLNIRFRNKRVSKFVLHDSLADFSLISEAYSFKYEERTYSVVYLSNENNKQYLRSQYLAILIDNYNKYIIPLPRYQSSTSLLNITSFAADQKLNVICYNPSITGKVETFQLEGKNWTLLNDYTCDLKLFDGFVWQIDFNKNNFLKKYYKGNALK